MADLLTPEIVREWLKNLEKMKGQLASAEVSNLLLLCRDYLTLLKRHRYNTVLLTAEIENLQDRNKELEKRFITARQILEHYRVPLDKACIEMVDKDFWKLI